MAQVNLGQVRDMARMFSDIKHIVARSLDPKCGNAEMAHSEYTVELYAFGRNRQFRLKLLSQTDVADTQLAMAGAIKAVHQAVGLVGTLGKSSEQVKAQLEFRMDEGLDEVRAEWNLPQEVAA